MALKQAIDKPQTPPNLRRGNARQRCGLCRYYDGKGGCRRYKAKVNPNQLSDGFSPASERM